MSRLLVQSRFGENVFAKPILAVGKNGGVTQDGNYRRNRDMPLVQRFAQVFGIIYLLVGVLGFVLPLLTGPMPAAWGPFSEYLFGLFAVNWFHNLAHLLSGAAGLAVYRSFSGSKAYALALGVVYAVLFLVGILSGGVGLGERGGLLPLNGWDNVLHLLTALGAFGAYYSGQPPEIERAPRRSGHPPTG